MYMLGGVEDRRSCCLVRAGNGVVSLDFFSLRPFRSRRSKVHDNVLEEIERQQETNKMIQLSSLLMIQLHNI